MNKENYKRAFSMIAPSDESLERIFDMTKDKKKFSLKPLLIAAVVSALTAATMFTVNASTNEAGKLASETQAGKQTEAKNYTVDKKTGTSAYGKKYTEYKITVDLDKNENGEVSIEDIDDVLVKVTAENNDEDAAFTVYCLEENSEDSGK